MPHQSRSEFVADEIAVTLRCTRVAASHRFGTALAAAEHSALQAAWSAGTVDAPKVQIICDGLVDVSSPRWRTWPLKRPTTPAPGPPLRCADGWLAG